MANNDTTLTNGSLDVLSQGQEEEPMGIKEALAERHQEFRGESNVTRLPTSEAQVICENAEGRQVVLSEEERLEADEAVREYALVKEEEAAVKRRMEKAKARILGFVGRLGVTSVDTPSAHASFKERLGNRSWDSKLLQEYFRGNDEALKKFYRPGAPWTQITVKPKLK